MDCEACGHANVDGARYCAKCGALMPVAASDDDDPLIGQVVGGRYRVVRLLGEGGMGRVYIAEQQMGTAVRKVAVKTLLQEFSKDPQVVARFMRECGTVVELEHPNTIKFFDFGQTDLGDLYIAMEFVDGKPLADVIESEGAMSPERVDKILEQISGSLHEAHEKGIVHRDLKPENVILTTRAGVVDFVKVLDFGIAKRNEAADSAREQKLTQAGMVLGTPPYMSPEQFTGKELDRRSDIYSLGVMAYEMLTGKLPFKATTPWEWATQHMTAQPHAFEAANPMATQIPPHIKAATMRALSKDQMARHATAKEFYADFKGRGVGAPAGTQVPSSVPAPPGGGSVSATEAFLAGPPAAATGGGGRPPGAGATQIGEPFVPPPGVGPGAPPPNPVPNTGGGQAIPTPGPAPGPMRVGAAGPRGGGNNNKLYAGAAAALVVVIGVVAFVGFGGKKEKEDEFPIVPVDGASAEAKHDDDGNGDGDEDASTPDPTDDGGDAPPPDPDPEFPDPSQTDDPPPAPPTPSPPGPSPVPRPSPQ
ncbi:MAG: serine/threonine-protein kinase, partial [Myxococcota bacterium]